MKTENAKVLDYLEFSKIYYRSQFPNVDESVIESNADEDVTKGTNLYTKVLFAQAILESGHFNSNVYHRSLNMFGMRPSQKRHMYYVGVDNSNYAVYEDLEHCIADRVNLDQFNRTQSPIHQNEVLDYIKAVKRKGYAEDPNYITKWFALYTQIFGDYDPVDPTDESNYDTSGSGWNWNFFENLKYIAYALVGWWLYKKLK